MDRRASFSFFRSFYEAISELKNAEDRDAVSMAVYAYALDGVVPSLSGVPAALFTLIRPNLDASKKKAESGQAGGMAKANTKQAPSNPVANRKQTPREIEVEKELEKEKESKPPLPPKEPKVQWADNVTMTNAEHDKLLATHGPANTVRLIEILDNYKGSSGKRYKDDYRAILSWCVDRLNEERVKHGGNQDPPVDPGAGQRRWGLKSDL